MLDVWSFGVVLWELFTLADVPYSDTEFEEMYQKLIKEYRLEQPIYASKDIYDIMLHCWEEEPILRPSFTMEGQLKTKEDNLPTTSLPDDITFPLIRQNYVNTLPQTVMPFYENVHNHVVSL
ncbi:tyrosine-protein kinase receptor Tie-1-like [Copidosoma floridanum]|uniref:tyrosine-protein kinase receptor Tie-1-like n=1 Tax=Copidosoma floridanum TaxID=29053 RepID=UPI0006C9ADF6|nr:tyrosine-protein kinase receptor Tie-1-like [Copidosoma floridanum]